MAGLGAEPLGIQATATTPIETSVASAGVTESEASVKDLTVAYVQNSWVTDLVAADVSATEEEEEFLISLSG